MKSRYLLIPLVFVFLLLSGNSWAQTQNSEDIWKDISPKDVKLTGERRIIPLKYRLVEFNLNSFTQLMATAPMEYSQDANNRSVVFNLPMPDGSLQRFQIVESPIMEKELADNFPEIKTYAGQGLDDATATIRFDITPHGFHAMVLSAKNGTTYIDPYAVGNTSQYIVYTKKSFVALGKRMDCQFQGNEIDIDNYRPSSNNVSARFGDCQLRTYRLALACTGEYATFHGGTVALAQAAQVTTMNRVNGIYEREVAIRMNIVANNNLLIYTNAGTDPYTNNDGFVMLGENQANIDAVIGSANYDIGHVFSTGGGGIASLNSPCSSSRKAQGVTGLPNPVGDPFDVDYVCHEMGHQYGATHTYNNSCGGNRTNATAFEPGSGSTIMAYAGICAPNVQNQSDDYFHAASLDQIAANVVSGTSSSCITPTILANSAPTVTNASGSYTIPVNTPFVLTATGSDPDPSNVLTYCWEQYDNEVSTQSPVANATVGPNFRSFDPTTSPSRYFPNLTDLISGAVTTWEVLPSVSRTMTFRVTLRDNATGGGCTDHDDVDVSTDASSGPFVVTNPTATGITWGALSTETVTWNVAGTDLAPVSCANVDILLSTDGGLTYPITLATGVPNDGSENISVPNNPTTTARIMVICSDNIFFDVSDNNFTITAPTSDYDLVVNDLLINICAPNDAVFNIDVNSISGFTDPVTLSVTGNPAGTTVAFATNPVTPGNSTTLTVSNTGAATAGSYTLTISGNSTTGVKTRTATLEIVTAPPATVTLTTPANAANNINTTDPLVWTAVTGATYDVVIATDMAFTNIVESATGLTTPTYTPTALTIATTYYWQVTPSNSCGAGTASSIFSFTTASCILVTSTDVPITIPATIATVTSTLTFPNSGIINDVNVIDLEGSHSYTSDLIVTLQSPSNTFVQLLNRQCNDGSAYSGFDFNFDDGAANNLGSVVCGTPPVGGGNTYQPSQPLNAFNGEDPAGTWTLLVQDAVNADGGSLNNWEIEVCFTPCDLTLASSSTAVSCFGTCDGSATVTATSSNPPYTYAWPNGQTTQAVNGLCAGNYIVTVSDAVCSAVTTVTIGGPDEIAIGIAATGESCTRNDGSATATPSLGTSPYTFSWNTSPAQTTATASGLSAGNYTVVVTDASGCTASMVATVPDDCCIITAALATTNVNCNGSCDGSISFSSPGGTLPYNILWSNGANTATISNLCAGVYSVSVTDANGCTGSSSATITEPTALSITINPTGESCAMNDGSALMIPAGGVFPYAIQWQDGQTANPAIGLSAGTFCGTITDGNGCTANTCVVVPDLCGGCSITSTITSDVVCSGLCDGTLTSTPTSGTGPYTFLWSNGANTATLTGLCQGNYSVTVTDAAGCTDIQLTTVSTGAPLVATSMMIQETCSNNDGEVQIAVTGDAPFSFIWNTTPAQTTQNATGLAAGSYTVTITDANGCTTSSTTAVTLDCTVSCTMVTTISSDNVCTGLCDGTLTVTASSGTPPYTYLWSNGSTTATVNGLCVGTYTVSVTDGIGCQNIETSSITATPSAMLSTNSTDESCAGNDGTATVTATGVTPFTYSWNTIPIQTTATATGLNAGTYTVIVTDGNGCTTTSTSTVIDGCGPPCLLVAVTTSTNETCFGVCDGTASATSTGGSMPVSYIWSNGQNTANISGLCGGIYNVTATDAVGCTSTSSVTITSATAIVLSAPTVTNELCGAGNGSATIATPTGGIAPYTYMWNTTPVQTGQTISNLSAGNYTVSVTDINGCVETASVSISNESLTASILSSTDESCPGACDGIAVIQATGASPYSVNGAVFTTSPITVSGLCAGANTLVVSDNNGCIVNVTVTISTSSNLTATATSTNATCANNDGSATVVANGGPPPFSYVWSTVPGQTTQTISGLSPGTYTATVTDNNGCTTTASTTVSFNNNLTATTTSTPTTCNGSNDGSATVASNIPGATYTWATTPPQMGATATNLGAGTYSVVVNAGACFVTVTATVTQPVAMSTTVVTNSQPCVPNGGTASAITTGGTPPFTFNWSNGGTTPSLVGLVPGTYSVTVTDSNGCMSTGSGAVTATGTSPSLTLDVDDVTCNGGSDGAVNLTVTGGLAPYTFDWSGITSTMEDLSNVPAGNYTVIVTDANGCVAVATANVTEPAPLTLFMSSTASTSGSNGSATALVNGGTAPYSYSWSNGGTTQTISNLAPGSYNVVVTDASGCIITSTVVVPVNTGIYDLEGLESFQLAPNPTNGQFNIQLSFFQPTAATLNVFAANGQLVREFAANGSSVDQPVDMGQVPAGVYFVVVTTEKGYATKRFIIQR